MPELQRLRAEHAPAVLTFEATNRDYFASFISDRGDSFFERFGGEFDAQMAEQEAGTCVFHVLVDEDGSVLGLCNLRNLHDGTADLGYRVAQRAAGHGVATAMVQAVCGLAAAQYGLHTLKAETSLENVASQKVLTKNGFVLVGPAQPGGRPGTLFWRDLTGSETR